MRIRKSDLWGLMLFDRRHADFQNKQHLTQTDSVSSAAKLSIRPALHLQFSSEVTSCRSQTATHCACSKIGRASVSIRRDGVLLR